MVLATDMAFHFDLLEKFNVEMANKQSIADWQDRNLVLQMILHLADLANPSRPFNLARRWAELVVAEFLQQVQCCSPAAAVHVLGMARSLNMQQQRLALEAFQHHCAGHGAQQCNAMRSSRDTLGLFFVQKTNFWSNLVLINVLMFTGSSLYNK
jgi:ferredoxin-NADP reductase